MRRKVHIPVKSGDVMVAACNKKLRVNLMKDIQAFINFPIQGKCHFCLKIQEKFYE